MAQSLSAGSTNFIPAESGILIVAPPPTEKNFFAAAYFLLDKRP